jgi:hypothetical protein
LTAHLRAHPETTLEDAAALANELLERYGINYEFAILEEERREAFDITLSAGPRRFVTDAVSDSGAGPCGERWVTVSAKHVDETHIAIVQNGKTFIANRLQDMALDTVKVFAPDGTTLLFEAHVPWQTIPEEVVPGGDAVVVYMPLYDDVPEWWKAVAKAHPGIFTRYPHLMLAVGAEGTRFLGDVERYVGHSFENVDRPGDKGMGSFFRRIRFKDSGFVIEFQAPCT